MELDSESGITSTLNFLNKAGNDDVPPQED